MSVSGAFSPEMVRALRRYADSLQSVRRTIAIPRKFTGAERYFYAGRLIYFSENSEATQDVGVFYVEAREEFAQKNTLVVLNPYICSRHC